MVRVRLTTKKVPASLQGPTYKNTYYMKILNHSGQLQAALFEVNDIDIVDHCIG